VLAEYYKRFFQLEEAALTLALAKKEVVLLLNRDSFFAIGKRLE